MNILIMMPIISLIHLLMQYLARDDKELGNAIFVLSIVFFLVILSATYVSISAGVVATMVYLIFCGLLFKESEM